MSAGGVFGLLGARTDLVVGAAGFAEEPLYSILALSALFEIHWAVELTTPRATLASGESPLGTPPSRSPPVSLVSQACICTSLALRCVGFV